MQFTKVLSAALILLPAAFAAEPEKLYLVNCYENGSAGHFLSSRMAWYAAGKGSSNGEVPGDQAIVNAKSYIIWENTARSGGFNSGATATSHIDAGADTLQTGQGAGWASNSYGTFFDCKKDNGRHLFTDTTVHSVYSCTSVYYCLRNN